MLHYKTDKLSFAKQSIIKLICSIDFLKLCRLHESMTLLQQLANDSITKQYVGYWE